MVFSFREILINYWRDGEASVRPAAAKQVAEELLRCAAVALSG
jgi:hypothetical protein